MWYTNGKESAIKENAMNDTIRIQGARENNLKNVNLTIPRDKLVEIGRASCRERV